MIGLAVAGREIVRRDTGERVVLRGVNRSGLEYAWRTAGGYLEGIGFSEAEVERMVREWNANVIRVPFVQELALAEADYRAALDRVIEWITVRGAYVLLDLQWLRQPTRISPLPDEGSVGLWGMLADRYKGEGGVLYDIYNEPHDVRAYEWNPWAERLTDAVREAHPEALVFVSGVDWGYDLRGVRVERENIVYSTHVYRWKTVGWARAWADRAAQEAVFAGEWGGGDADLSWSAELADRFDALGMGWTAWSWSDEPRLLQDGVVTAFGELVKGRLSALSS